MTSDAGESTADEARCPECGTSATPGARFCRVCGLALSAADAPASVGGRDVAGTRRPRDSETTGELDRISRTNADVSPPRSGLALRTCPNCGAPNSPHRELCGRCGADLETGTVPPRSDGRATDPAATAPGPSARRRVGPALLGLLLVLALLVGGLRFAGLDPFGADADAVPSATFDPESYAGAPSPLPIAEIATLTTLPPQGGVTYDASQMVDNDAATAWNSDGSNDEVTDGVGERIELLLSEPAWVDRIVLRNGDQRDAASYAANARIRRAQVTMDGGVVLLVNLLDEGLALQAVELSEPVLTTGISIEVLDTFAGDTHPDLAVSDLEFQGWPAQGEDREVARERAAVRSATGSGSG